MNVTTASLAALFRAHSRLRGALAANLETWLADSGTLARYLSLIPSPRAGETKLLEIGCYQPTVGYYLELGWRDVVGTFLDEGEGTQVDEYRGEHGQSVRFLMADAERERLPVPDGWADAVVMLQVWEHFALDPMHVLWEINRALKPGGRLILSTPNGACWQFAQRIARGSAAWGSMEFTGYSTNRHNRLYDADELQTVFRQAGFEPTLVGSRDFGAVDRHWTARCFRGALAVFDWCGALVSGRRRERGGTLFIEGTKSGPPRERFPGNLYLTDRDWPGITAERDRALGGRE
jgi:SAM-dependent methyltransferase